MNNYFTRLSFEKLENFDMQRSRLSSFVLIRNSLITALTTQQQQQIVLDEEYDPTTTNMMCEDMIFEGEEQQVWLDSCFHQLQDTPLNKQEEQEQEQEQEYDEYYDDSSEEDEMPLSPQNDSVPFYNNNKKATFFINEEEEEEDGLICYDIPFLSL